MTYYTQFHTWLCPIILAGDSQGICHLHLDTRQGKRRFAIDPNWVRNDSFLDDAVKQINAYFNRELTSFNLPLNPKGTDFQKRVWKELCKVPFGQIATYGQIAKAIGKEKAARAVGMANSKNPIPLIVPCHRIVGANGSLTGFAHGVNTKERLLQHEQGDIQTSSKKE